MLDLIHHAPEALAVALYALLERTPAAPLVQLGLEVRPVDLLEWLQGQDEVQQFFWTSRKRAFQVAAAGAVRSWPSLAELEPDLQGLAAELRCYGGWRFDAGRHGTPWQDWPDSGFFLPRWELRCEQGQYRLCLNLAGEQTSWRSQVDDALARLRPPSDLPPALPPLAELHHQPGSECWREQVEQAQQLFARGDLHKLVLSRVSQARLAALPLTLMRRLLSQGREAYHVWYRPLSDQVLWGASPERLYARSGRTLWTEALAGTRQRDTDPQRQEALRQELLGSHKEFEENERVRQHLEAALAPFTTGLRAEPLRVIPSGPVQHLYRCLQAELSGQITDTRLVQALHPTPAVSGFESGRAQAVLRELEAHDRGWYSGALGWISPQAAEWSVVLRCALWKQQVLHFYTGAGIMPASDPEAEWQELNLKLSSLLALWD